MIVSFLNIPVSLFVLKVVFFISFNISGKESMRIVGHPILWTVDFNHAKNTFAVGGDDSLLRLYNSAKLDLISARKLRSKIKCLDWNIDGRLLAIGLDGKPVTIFNLEAKTFIELIGTTGSRALAWNHDGKLLAVGDYDGTLQIWTKAGKLMKTIRKENGTTILSVDWHPKKNIVLAVGDRIRLFNVDGSLLFNIKHRIEETIILSVKWHPRGHFFVVGDYGEKENNFPSILQFWTDEGKLIKTIQGSEAEYRNIRWDKGGKHLATASDKLRIWSSDGDLLNSGTSMSPLWGIDWDKSGSHIVTSSSTGEISLWGLQAHRVLIAAQ
jgi:WD40 repeat protein